MSNIDTMASIEAPTLDKKPPIPDPLATLVSLTPQRIRPQQFKTKAKPGRKITLVNYNETLEIVCPSTGIVSIISIPRINGVVLEWTSPFADLSNCRGIVQKGIEYLNKLETQILAGLVITLADDYNLFTYQPSYTGAQKNSILRSAGKDCLINALLLIEEYVNSSNAFYMPRLSLILTASSTANSISSSMTEWLKLVAEKIAKASYAIEDTEETFYSQAPKKTIQPQLQSIANKKKKADDWKETNKKWAEQRTYKADVKAAKESIKMLIKAETLSAKLQGLLKSVFTEETLLTIDSSMRILLASKLDDFSSLQAKTLADILRKPYSILRGDFDSLGELDSPNDNSINNEPTNNEPTIVMALDFTDSIKPIAPLAIQATPKLAKTSSLLDRIRAAKIAALAVAGTTKNEGTI